MRILELDADYSPGLYDSDTGESLSTERAVDITEDCPSGERTILLFTKAKRGRIVKIVHPYDGEKIMGASIHFFVDELRNFVTPRDDTFGIQAKRAGLDRADFRRLIKANAIAVTNGDR